jgi:transcriptional regulator with XRE-family HTH domain
METTDTTATQVESTNTIGVFIRRRRLALGMSQADLGRKVGKNQVWASQQELGYKSVRAEEVHGLAQALEVDEAELRAMAGASNRSAEPVAKAETPTIGVVTEEAITTNVLRWQVGDRTVLIEELDREDLLGAVRSLFDTNAALRAEFDTAVDEIAVMYEEKVRSLHHLLAANVEMGIREAVRDKMDVIVEAVTAAFDRRQSAVADDTQQQEVTDKEEEVGNEY